VLALLSLPSARRIFSSEQATWCRSVTTSYKAVRDRCESCPTSLAEGEDYILYAILDFIVDNYRPVIDCIQAEVDHLEEEVLRKSLPKREFDRLYRLRRDLLRRRRAVGPMNDVCKRLDHADLVGVRDGRTTASTVPNEESRQAARRVRLWICGGRGRRSGANSSGTLIARVSR
jgi:Mg2+ and Co2+ transporter CorA